MQKKLIIEVQDSQCEEIKSIPTIPQSLIKTPTEPD